LAGCRVRLLNYVFALCTARVTSSVCAGVHVLKEGYEGMRHTHGGGLCPIPLYEPCIVANTTRDPSTRTFRVVVLQTAFACIWQDAPVEGILVFVSAIVRFPRTQQKAPA